MSKKKSLFVLSILTVLAIGLITAPGAQAQSAYTIDAGGSGIGGGCAAIGTWDNASKTCTLNRDVNIPGSTSGIEITGDGVTLDGAGYSITLTGALSTQRGIHVYGRDSVTVNHLTVKGFKKGIYLSSCTNVIINADRLESNGNGVEIAGGNSNTVYYSDLISNTSRGVYFTSTSSNSVSFSNFISNPTQSYVSGGSGNVFGANYFDDFDSNADGCVNVSSFNSLCDSSYTFSGGTSSARVLRDMSGRLDWTWYDNVGGDNWVLLANHPRGDPFLLFDLRINNMMMSLSSVAGGSPGYVPKGSTIYNKYEGLVGGPVTAVGRGVDGLPIASQRILWPKSGNSLEEVNGTSITSLDSRLYWTWYDMASPGYKNWILISNPNAYQVNYNIKIAGTVMETGTIPANGRVTPSFPGVIGGPVEVNGFNSIGDPVYIMGSQRVLSNGDMAFNEQPGQPANGLSDHYVWTWYDQVSSGAKNWVLVANPPDAPTQIYYEIWIAGVKVKNGGPIASGGNETPTFPGTIGGPVEVKSFSDAAHTVAADSIASQRIIWGPSFGEVLGDENSSLDGYYVWTWYDQQSPGARNWVLVANPPGALGDIWYEIWIAGVKVKDGGPIAPGGNETPAFHGTLGGPVVVKSFSNAAHTLIADSIASQRVLWNGYFNEVWGQ